MFPGLLPRGQQVPSEELYLRKTEARAHPRQYCEANQVWTRSQLLRWYLPDSSNLRAGMDLLCECHLVQGQACHRFFLNF